MKELICFALCTLAALFLKISVTKLVITDDCSCTGERGGKLTGQHFGMAITTEDIFTPTMIPRMVQNYYRPWQQMAALIKDSGSTIKTEKDKFQINLDVQHFLPDEISVKTADGYVVIEAKHEEKEDDHGHIARQFVRKYSLPEGAESENVVSEVSSDGILTVTAPRKVVNDKGQRQVPITQTGPVRKVVKESKGGLAVLFDVKT